MKKDKFQITKAELQQIIKEEYAAMAKDASKAEKIKARIAAINEELKTLPSTLSEVEASGTKSVKSTGWTGAGKGDVKYGEKFEKIGSHLKEDDEAEGGIEGAIEIGGDESASEMGYFETKFSELGKELDAKISGGAVESEESEESEEGGEGMGLDVDVEEIDEVSNEGANEGVAEVVAEVSNEGANESEMEEALNEDLEEPIEGESPAQDSDARFNDYMDKDKHVKEGVKKAGTTVLSEGRTPAQKSALDKELERMKALARIK